MRGNQPRDRHTPGKMRLEGFIFDCDGTLADTMPLVMSSFRQALARHLERPWKDADFISLFGLTEKGIFKTLSPDRLALADLFDAVETGSDERPNKPGAIQKVLAGWGARPDRVVYVGDAAYDMEAAREAGAIPLGAAWVAADRAALQAAKPAWIFDHAEDFLNWIEEEVEIAGPNVCR